MNNILDFYYMFDNQDKYEQHLLEHIKNVRRAYDWMVENIPEVLSEDNYVDEQMYYGDLDEIIAKHDSSKYKTVPDSENYYDLKCEYDAYAEYFYGERNELVDNRFDHAWLSHIHQNPHHWQHWLLQNDEDGLKTLDMPYVFICEMICDWWSFSWKQNKLDEIFNWYEKHKEAILISDKTRNTLEDILAKLKKKLEEVNT